MVSRRRLLHEDIEGGTAKMTRLQRRDERLLIDDAASGAVEDASALLHASELRGADQVACLVGQRRVDGEEVAARQELVEVGDRLDPELSGPFRSEERVEADHLHIETGGAAGDL